VAEQSVKDLLNEVSQLKKSLQQEQQQKESALQEAAAQRTRVRELEQQLQAEQDKTGDITSQFTEAAQRGDSLMLFDDQIYEMANLCEDLVKDHEAHQTSVAECVRESRKALAVMKNTSPKFASILAGRKL